MLVKFVLLEDRARYEADGWTLSSDMAGQPHGRYSILMERDEAEPAAPLPADQEIG